MMDAPRGLAVVGPGLIGTSVALAARRRWPGLDVRTIDKGQPLSAIGDAEVVVLAAPVEVILDLLPRLAGRTSTAALVLDTGSTKRAIMAAAAASHVPHFVGGHPMAGGTSLADARADLFDGRPWFLTNPDAPAAVTRAAALVEALGATPVVLADRGEEHDRLMAALSHLPQVTSSVLMTIVARSAGTDNLRWAGHGLRDTTRLAASTADAWHGVLASNRHELTPLLRLMASELAALADRLDSPEAIRGLFDDANRAKAALK